MRRDDLAVLLATVMAVTLVIGAVFCALGGHVR